MTELSTLERKPLSDLHQIAAQLGIEQYRKYRKPALAELIYKTATEQAVGQQTAKNGDENLQSTPDLEASGAAGNTSSATVETANGKVVDETVTEPAETHLYPFSGRSRPRGGSCPPRSGARSHHAVASGPRKGTGARTVAKRETGVSGMGSRPRAVSWMCYRMGLVS